MLRQFLASMEDDTDDKDRQLVDALDDVVFHLVGQSKDDNDDKDDDERPFSRIARIGDDYSPAAFVATLQKILVMHAITKKKLDSFGNSFQGIKIDTSATRGSISGRTQYFAYCRATGREAEINTSRAAV